VNIYQIDTDKLNSAFSDFKEKYAVTNPRPERPKVDKPPRVELKRNWRAWAFIPVAVAATLVAAIRTAAAANRIASIEEVLPFVPSQFEALLAVVAVDVTIVIGMLVLAYSRLMTLNQSKLKKEMENLKFLKLAVSVALTISLTANITQVFREQFEILWPWLDTSFDVSIALAFSIGLNVLALVSAEQVAYLLAWTRLENLEIESGWKSGKARQLDEYQKELDEWESKVVRAWNSQKSKILGLSKEPVQNSPEPSKVRQSGLPGRGWTKHRKLQYVLDLISANTNGSGGVTYAQVENRLGTISRAAFYGYTKELVEDGRLENDSAGGWRVPNGEGF